MLMGRLRPRGIHVLRRRLSWRFATAVVNQHKRWHTFGVGAEGLARSRWIVGAAISLATLRGFVKVDGEPLQGDVVAFFFFEKTQTLFICNK